MNPEKQRVAIAEACGWDNIKYQGVEGLSNKTYLAGKPPENSEDAIMGEIWPIPDYLSDLNAMHEVEKTLTGTAKWTEYNAKLFLVAAGINLAAGVNRAESLWLVHHATAAQRAEAFLKTIIKWEDEA